MKRTIECLRSIERGETLSGIARHVGCSRRTVQREVKVAERHGWVIAVYMPNTATICGYRVTARGQEVMR